MKKTYEIKPEETEKIREKMKAVKKINLYKRLEVAALLSEGQTVEQIVQITKKHEKVIRTLGNLYNRVGLEEFSKDARKGGNRRLMDEKESQDFLSQFEEAAHKGQIITVSEIAKAFDAKTNKERASLSTIYKFLHRNGWRKVMPSSKHPNKASEEVIEASKKLKPNIES